MLISRRSQRKLFDEHNIILDQIYLTKTNKSFLPIDSYFMK